MPQKHSQQKSVLTSLNFSNHKTLYLSISTTYFIASLSTYVGVGSRANFFGHIVKFNEEIWFGCVFALSKKILKKIQKNFAAQKLFITPKIK